jgi:hypothetical protein
VLKSLSVSVPSVVVVVVAVFLKKLKSYFMSDKQPPKYPNRHDSGIPTNELVIPFPATTITTITTIQNRI